MPQRLVDEYFRLQLLLGLALSQRLLGDHLSRIPTSSLLRDKFKTLREATLHEHTCTFPKTRPLRYRFVWPLSSCSMTTSPSASGSPYSYFLNILLTIITNTHIPYHPGAKSAYIHHQTISICASRPSPSPGCSRSPSPRRGPSAADAPMGNQAPPRTPESAHTRSTAQTILHYRGNTGKTLTEQVDGD